MHDNAYSTLQNWDMDEITLDKANKPSILMHLKICIYRRDCNYNKFCRISVAE